MLLRSFGALLGGFLVAGGAGAQGAGTVGAISKISQTRGGPVPPLHDNDQLGRAVTVLGDLDGNGVPDLATAGVGDDDGGANQGAVRIFFLRSNGRVLRSEKISALAGGFTGDLDPGDQFGRSLACIGDLDGDGVPDLAVGANYDDDGGTNRGAVWILFLNADGTVRESAKISSTQGEFAGPLHNDEEFGRAVTPLGDLDGDGTIDLAVGAPTDGTGGPKRGAVWILFLRPDGRVARSLEIASGKGGFGGTLHDLDWFGFSLANPGDLDGDGVTDLVVGAALDDDGGENSGAVWLLYLRPDGRVKDQRKISRLAGGFTGELESPDLFGTSVTSLGDVNGDGVTDLAVGAVKDDDGGRERGAVYVLFLTPEGSVASHQKISDLEGGFPDHELNDLDWFGSSLAPLGDFDGDGVPDLASGARNDDDGGANRGAVYLTLLNGPAPRTPPRVREDRLPRPLIPGEPTLFVPPEDDGLDCGSEAVLELVEGEARPGARLRFQLPVPAALREESALVRLLVGAEPVGERTTPAWLARRAHVAGGEAEIEFRLRLPRAGLPASLAFRAEWRSGRGRMLTNAIVLPRASDARDAEAGKEEGPSPATPERALRGRERD